VAHVTAAVRDRPRHTAAVRSWSEAWQRALYGADGFFRREAPRDHFRTSVTASPVFAQAVRRLAGVVDDLLERPDPFDVVDLGAGRGELLLALPDVPARWRLTAVERAPDPGVGVHWLRKVPPLTGLLLAHEWLDDVPLDVVDDGRVVLVDESGTEVLGPPAPLALLEWSSRWWPDGGRVEIGLSRDRAWADAVAQVRRGLAVAVDYGHLLRPALGATAPRPCPDASGFGGRRRTLTGYRRGRAVPPVPDGSCDLTAHVALDSVAAATGSRLLRQREVLRALGVDGRLPATADPQTLQRASQAATLIDPAGFGGFGWLVRAVGTPDPLGEVPATIGP
jgi:SAM-dependent MidA family methyltransferase